MQSKLPLLPSGPGGVRKSTVHGPWRQEYAATGNGVQEKLEMAMRDSDSSSVTEIVLVTVGYRELPQVTGNVKVDWNLGH